MLHILTAPVQSVAVKFDPNQPRDDRGRWGTGHTSAAAMRAEPLPKTLAAAEDRIRHEFNEHAFVLRNGKPVLVLGDDDPFRVKMALSGVDLKGAVVTHNHPSGMGLSKADATTAAQRNVRELRAVVKTGTHSIRRTGREWPSNLRSAVEAMHEEVKRELGMRIHAGEITKVEANAMHHKLLYSRLAEQLGGFIYTFEPHGS